jgi:hypothetical protein
MELLIHLLVVVIVIACLFWVISHVPIPAPYTPVTWILYLIVVVIALAALLPFLGVNLGV